MAVLEPEELRAALAERPGWFVEGKAIVRRYELDGGFVGSMRFVNRLAEAAEAANHHPDLFISWNKVTVSLSTHSEGGVTERDLSLAGEADRLAAA
jgi:4a-hydroxytetrahydrobiopterin dehydratase